VGRAIALSVPALAANPRELPWQIFGRLGHLKDAIGTVLAQAARDDHDLGLTPRWPGLTPPGAERLRLVGHDDRVTSAAFSPDGARIVTASLDNTARLWDAASGEPIRVLTGHGGWVASAAFSPDGARIVTASADNTARLWDAASGEPIRVLTGHESAVNSAAFSPDGACIVTASDDKTARLWDAASGEPIRVLTGHANTVTSAAFSPDGARIVTASYDNTARLWDTSSGAELARVTLDAAVRALAISGTTIALGDALGRLHAFDAPTPLTAGTPDA
jgi:WD40 repeat protein